MKIVRITKQAWGFRGNFVHKELFQLVQTGEISFSEAWTLITIDNYADSRTGISSASNETLAKDLNIGVRRVQLVIRKLEHKGFLCRVTKNGVRGLLTPLSRPIQGFRGTNRSSHVNRSSRGPSNISSDGGDIFPLKGNIPPPPYSGIKKMIRISHVTHCEDCSKVEWRSWGEELKNSIAQVTTVPRTAKPTHWGASIQSLHTRDGYSISQIRDVLSWYCNLLPIEGDINTNGNPNFVPVAYSGESFRKKFVKLQAARSRDKGSGKTMRVSTREEKRPSSKKPKLSKRDRRNFYADEW